MTRRIARDRYLLLNEKSQIVMRFERIHRKPNGLFYAAQNLLLKQNTRMIYRSCSVVADKVNNILNCRNAIR